MWPFKPRQPTIQFVQIKWWVLQRLVSEALGRPVLGSEGIGDALDEVRIKKGWSE